MQQPPYASFPRSRRTPFLLIFILLMVAEFWIIAKVAAHLGAGNTILLILITSAAGIWVLRSNGLGFSQRMQNQILSGEPAGRVLVNTLGLLAAGVLLVIPGFLTDALGLLLLLPQSRALASRLLSRRLGSFSQNFAQNHKGPRVTVHTWSSGDSFTQATSWNSPEEEGVIDAEVVDVTPRRQDDPKKPLP